MRYCAIMKYCKINVIDLPYVRNKFEHVTQNVTQLKIFQLSNSYKIHFKDKVVTKHVTCTII